MIRYKKSTGNIKVTADKIKYEIMGELSPMDLYIIDDIIKTRDDVVIEGDNNRVITLLTGLASDIDNIDFKDLDTQILDEIARDYCNMVEREILQTIQESEIDESF